METPQLIAVALAGFAAPFIQEVLFGARVSGRAASMLAAVIAFVVGTLATWATGGFAGAASAPAFSLLDPREFLGFWATIFTPVYAVSQLFYGITTKHGDEHPPAQGIVQSVAAAVQPMIGTSAPDS
jgi:hypothetical protein